MTNPAIVQSAFTRSSTGTLTVTLGASPTTGNLLALIVTGSNAAPTVIPAGLTALETDAGLSVGTEGSWIYYRTVLAGDSATWTFSTSALQYNLAVLELSGTIASMHYQRGACTGSGTSSIATIALTACSDSNALRLLLLEWSNGTGATDPSGYTLQSPTGWQNTGTHDAALWTFPTTNAGVQTITMSGATTTPIFVDLQFKTIGSPVNMTQTFSEIIANNPNTGGVIAQTFTEVVANKPNPSAFLSNIYIEVLGQEGLSTNAFIMAMT